jgi:sec-independent protein translocase protein TatA
MIYSTLAFMSFGPWEILLLALAGLLIFGRRLPEVGKSLGRGIVEFKKGLSGIEDDINLNARNDGKRIEGGSPSINDATRQSTPTEGKS